MTLAQWEIPCDSVKSIITQTFRKHENKVTHDYIPLNYAEAILQKKWLTLRNEEMESYMVIHVDSFQHSLVKAMYSPPPPPKKKGTSSHPTETKKQQIPGSPPFPPFQASVVQNSWNAPKSEGLRGSFSDVDSCGEGILVVATYMGQAVEYKWV